MFSGLSEEELGFLIERVVPRHFTSNEMVFSEGQRCSGLYVVASGHVRIFKTSGAGREQVLSIDGLGNSIAEVPLFDGGNYPASCASVGDTTLLFVSKRDFQALCLVHPQVTLKVLRVVGARQTRIGDPLRWQSLRSTFGKDIMDTFAKPFRASSHCSKK
jgi:CRP/FNR family transcriptional regulator